MQIPLKMSFEGGLTASEALCARIEHEAEKLARVSDRIAACRVSVVGRGGRRRRGELYDVKLTLAVSGRGDMVVTRNPSADHAHEDVYVAIRDAFEAARRRLQYDRARFSGRRKSHALAQSGVVSRIAREDGFGFIETADGREVYFHRNAVLNGGFQRLEVGAPVRFSEEDGEKGPQASTVHA